MTASVSQVTSMSDARPGQKPPETARTDVALCLAGGGFAGTFFEFGAVAALQAVLDGWSPVRSRVIVGTSCGAVAGALLAMGMDPDEIPRILRERNHPLAPRPSRLSRFLWKRHLAGWGRAAAALPRLVRNRRNEAAFSWSDLALDLHRVLPAGLFSNAGIESFVRRAARRLDASDCFRDLPVPFRVTALDLDTGERIVFDPDFDPAPPVSRAVRASTAIPAYFEPVRIGERDLVDGQIFDPIHLDLAAGSGARVILGVSPLAPVRRDPQVAGSRVRDWGAVAALEQTARVSATIKQSASLARLRRDNPDLSVFLFEASSEDATRLLRAGAHPRAWIELWELGFDAALRALEAQKESLAAALTPLGITLDLNRRTLPSLPSRS